jgi:hypothetical protein
MLALLVTLAVNLAEATPHPAAAPAAMPASKPTTSATTTTPAPPPEVPAAPTPAPAAQRPLDSDAPGIEDVAVASSNPDVAPVVTAVLSDNGSGIGSAIVSYRVDGAAEWQTVALAGKPGDNWVGRLPDGTQRTGFSWCLDVTDKMGNAGHLGTRERPFAVPAATEGTLLQLEHEPQKGVHPAWVMVAFGAGVLSGAGAGAFAIDLATSTTRAKNAADATTRTALQKAITQDAAIASVLGVVGAAGIATGIMLLVFSAE